MTYEPLPSVRAAGSAFSSAVLYPLDLARTRLNRGVDSRGRAYDDLRDVCRRVHHEQGPRGFYVGVQARTLQQFVQKFVYFYVYDGFGRIWDLRSTTDIMLRRSTIAGYVAGVMTLLIASPLEVVSTRQQLGVSWVGEPQQAGVLSGLTSIAKDEGICSLYKGWSANLCLCLNPAIQNALFDQARRVFLRRRAAKSLSVAQECGLGAVATLLATSITFPCIRAKIILQSIAAGARQLDRNGGQRFSHPTLAPSTLQVLRAIVRDEGCLALWKGVVPQAAQCLLSSAARFAAKGRIDATMRLVFGKAVRTRARWTSWF